MFNKDKDELLLRLRSGKTLTLKNQIQLTAALSLPAIMAQLSSIVMQYIDASMVGSLGAAPSASIGLVSTSTWLFGGLCGAVSTGFSVQVAHLFGASRMKAATSVVRQALVAAICFSVLLSIVGVMISGGLPIWLGGGSDITENASRYFLIFALTLPFFQCYSLAAGVLRCSGDILTPSIVGVAVCLLDVAFNFLLIFPSRSLAIGGFLLTIPGANLGVVGAALGTSAAVLICMGVLLYFMFRIKAFKPQNASEVEKPKSIKAFLPQKRTIREAARIGLPMGVEHAVMCGAQIMTTVIVAPLGTLAIAANNFAITAESLCYMPGYGIMDATTTLVGQSMGAGRLDVMKRFAYITVGLGMLVMTIMGVLMYAGAPLMMGILTPVEQVRQLGVGALRIEAFAEPMFAASIVAYGVFIGIGDTIVPAAMNLGSIWAVRLTLAAILARTMGLRGVWTAMCIELCFRGAIFLFRLWKYNWKEKVMKGVN